MANSERPQTDPQCPSADHLRQVAVGAATAAQEEAVARHLEQCQICRRRMERMFADTQDVERLRAAWTTVSQAESVANTRPDDRTGARSPAEPWQGPEPGQTWGKYLVESVLGKGGQAVVYQAFDRLGPAGHVALKMPRYPLPPAAVEKWVRTEVQPLAALDHPNIVRILDAGAVDGTPYVATELIDGLPLDKYVEVRPPTLWQMTCWMIQLADAIDAAHRAGVLHRDLKSQNIVVTKSGRPMILDFGISQLIDAYRANPAAGLSGTPGYMAPEQARVEPAADHRVDVFALGGVLKFLLTGLGPYGSRPTREDYLQAAKEGTVEPVDCTAGPRLRRALGRIANRAMNADPAGRFGNAGQLAAALRWPSARRRVMAGVAACILLAVVAIGAYTALPRLSGTRQSPALPPGPAPGANAPSAVLPDAKLEIHFQRASQQGSYQLLAADLLPLHDGDRVQIHVEFTEPLVAYVLAANSTGQVSLIYPAAGQPAAALKTLSIPAEQDQWLPLTPPEGTESVLLLAGRKPIEHPEILAQEVKSLGPPPGLDGVGLLLADRDGVRLIENKAATHRVIGDRPVSVSKGFLANLAGQVPARWLLTRAICFTHESRAATTREDNRE